MKFQIKMLIWIILTTLPLVFGLSAFNPKTQLVSGFVFAVLELTVTLFTIYIIYSDK